MEQIKGAGNTYKTRIYPIPANGTYTIEIHYTDSLAGSITWDEEAVSLITPQRDGICRLYNDLIGLVMGWLPDTDILSLAMVNHKFWKVICVGLVHLPMNFSEAKRLSVRVLRLLCFFVSLGKRI